MIFIIMSCFGVKTEDAAPWYFSKTLKKNEKIRKVHQLKWVVYALIHA